MLNKEILSIISDLKNNKDNLNRCFECNMLCSNYISTYYGIFLCFVCANIHKKKLSKEYSNLVEIKPDNIEALQNSLDYLFCGGNKRFAEFLEMYDLKPTPNTENLQQDKNFVDKYKTYAAEYYRKMLDNEAKGKVLGNFTNFEENNADNIDNIDNIANIANVAPSFEQGRKIKQMNNEKMDAKLESVMIEHCLDRI